MPLRCTLDKKFQSMHGFISDMGSLAAQWSLDQYQLANHKPLICRSVLCYARPFQGS